MIDFTNCKQFNKAYAGANGSKLCIEYNKEKYMLKFPSVPTKRTSLSYANGCISEYISCHIYELLKIPVQETILGTYKKGDKEKIVVACKDFTDIGIVLQDFASLKNQIIDSENNGYGTELSDILHTIDEQTAINPIILKQRFWDMFVVDSLLGNFDRHNGNWGFLYNQFTDELSLAPVYDCGSCLYPQADKDMIKIILNNTGEMNTRIYNFPTSAVKNNGKKISYYEYLINTTNKDCLNSLIRNYELISMEKINNFINDIECLDDLQKTFYTTMLQNRYNLILTPAYERALSLNKDNNMDIYNNDFDEIDL